MQLNYSCKRSKQLHLNMANAAFKERKKLFQKNFSKLFCSLPPFDLLPAFKDGVFSLYQMSFEFLQLNYHIVVVLIKVCL